MASGKQILPSYRYPPVVEVVCGVAFEQLPGFTSGHIGRFWNSVKRDFPKTQDQAPLSTEIESFGDVPQPIHSFSIEMPQLPRAWFLNQKETELIQVQRDWFLFNWKKVEPSDVYPRYPQVSEKFFRYRDKFDGFLSENLGQTLEARQFELTYVNHIPINEGWDSLESIGDVFPDFRWRPRDKRPENFLPAPERINWQTSFAFPDKTGRLHISIVTAWRMSDSQPILRLDMRTRGANKSKNRQGMAAWFDKAHEWIVKGFADITGSEIQSNVWKRRT